MIGRTLAVVLADIAVTLAAARGLYLCSPPKSLDMITMWRRGTR